MMTVDVASPVGSRVASSNHRSAAGTGRLSVGGNAVESQTGTGRLSVDGIATARSSLPTGCSAIGVPDRIGSAAASSVHEAASVGMAGGSEAACAPATTGNGSPKATTGRRHTTTSAAGSVCSTSASVSVFSVKTPVLPSRPPDVVQQWLRREDWEALRGAWAAAEAQAIAWEEGELEDPLEDMFDDDFDESWPDVDLSSSPASTASPTFSSSETRPTKSRRKPWNEDFHLIGQDSRKPAPLRRYFDSVPSETSPKMESVRPGMRPKAGLLRGDDEFGPDSPSERWDSTFWASASTDNDGLHPHLRHYFDRRGLEASYRMRPHCDHKWLQALPPRTPGRPSSREMLLRGSSSEPALGSGTSLARRGSDDKLDVKARGVGSIHWGQRCLIHGPNGNVKRGHNGEKIPWVSDHSVTETDDNEIMNPMLRHYFDADGIESSFRNRGRHYGRPTKMCFGIPPIEHKQAPSKPAPKKASKTQVPMSLEQGDVTLSPKRSSLGSKRSSSLGGASEIFPKAPGAKRVLGKRETSSTSSLSMLADLEADYTGRRSVGHRSAPGGLLAAAVSGASPSSRSTGNHSAPAVFGELPSPGGRLAEQRRTIKELLALCPSGRQNATATAKDALSPARVKRCQSMDQAPSVPGSLERDVTFGAGTEGAGGKFTGAATFGAETFAAAAAPEVAAGEQLAATATFGGVPSPSSRRNTANFGLASSVPAPVADLASSC